MSELGIAATPSEPVIIAEYAAPTFRDVRWKFRWLVVALLGLAVFRSLAFLKAEWLPPIPGLFLVFLIVPQGLFLAYPFLVRPREKLDWHWPTFPRLCLETFLAGGIAWGLAVFFTCVQFVLMNYWPDFSLGAKQYADLAYAPNTVLVLGILLFSFTFAPIAEEVFFRGFLHNALRQRMPLPAATLLSATIFGFIHSYSFAHSMFAFSMGVVLSLVYEWRRTLFTPIVIHITTNFFAALGVVVMMVQAANAPALGVVGEPKDERCIVRSVLPGSPAEQAGLQTDDVILTFNGEPIKDFLSLRAQVIRYRSGDQIPITFERDGQTMETTATLILGRQLKVPPPQSP